MADIQEVLTLVDQFTAPFTKFISMAEKAAGSTSAAQRSADTMVQSQRAAAEMAQASFSAAEASSQRYQSALNEIDQKLISVNTELESTRKKQEEMASAGAAGTREYAALERKVQQLTGSLGSLNSQYSIISVKSREAALSAKHAAQAASEASQNFAATMITSTSNVFSGKAEQVQAYAQELLSVQQQIKRANVELNVHQKMLSAVSSAQGAASSDAVELTSKLSSLAAETISLKDRQSALRSALEQAAGGSRKANAAIRQYERTTQVAASSTNALVDQVKRLAGAYLSLRGLKGLVGLSDTMASVSARLDLVNEKFGTTLDLQKMINDTAQRSRSSYLDTASAVSKMALNAGSAFTGPQDAANFMEQVNKQFVIAGASASEQRNAMIQLTQAMAAGTLRGEELNSILDQAPGIARAIESYMGIAEGSIKRYAEKGAITAQVVKNAMFAAADDTNRKFESMPMTWSQIATKMQNIALEKFTPVLDKINEIANSERFSKVMNGAIDGISRLADTATEAMDLLMTAGAYVVDNWSEIGPVVEAVTGTFIVYKTVQAACTSVTRTFTSAQQLLNAAMLGCPVTWIVLGITAVVAVIYLAVNAFNQFAGTSISATGVVAGTFAVMAAFILNSSIIPVQRGFAELANFIGNIFNSPAAAIKILFYDTALTVLGYFRSIAHGIEDLINKIPGVQKDLTSGIDRWYNDFADSKEKAKEASGWKEYVKPMEYLDLSEAFQKSYDAVEKMTSSSKRKRHRNSAADDASSLPSYIPYDELSGALSDISKDVGKISKSVSLSEEAARTYPIHVVSEAGGALGWTAKESLQVVSA